MDLIPATCQTLNKEFSHMVSFNLQTNLQVKFVDFIFALL